MDRYGFITYILSIGTYLIVYYGILKKRRDISGFIIILFGLAIFNITLIETIELTSLTIYTDLGFSTLGIGYYLTGVGGVGLIIAGSWNPLNKDK